MLSVVIIPKIKKDLPFVLRLSKNHYLTVMDSGERERFLDIRLGKNIKCHINFHNQNKHATII